MSGEFICTKEQPWSPEKTGSVGMRIVHPNAYEVGEQENGWPGGDIVTMQCPNCGKRFTMELPQ